MCFANHLKREIYSIKHTFKATTFKVEENSRTFQRLAQKFKDFSRKNGIQGLFNDYIWFSRTFQDCANPEDARERLVLVGCLSGDRLVYWSLTNNEVLSNTGKQTLFKAT